MQDNTPIYVSKYQMIMIYMFYVEKRLLVYKEYIKNSLSTFIRIFE